MKSTNDIVLKLLGILLLTAAILKGWQLLTEPVANNDIWSYRPFLIFTVEFEIALGIWLLSGLFKKAVWLAGLLCFGLFSCITLYKGITGAESCGCFGSVHVNPWITLFAVDIPAVILLVVFRPALSFLRKQKSMKAFANKLLAPIPSKLRLTGIGGFLLLMLVSSTTVLALNEPARITSTYEILEPEAWVGKKLPIMEHIDIAEKLKKGRWLVLFYHHDCPDCIEAISQLQQIAHDLADNQDFLQIAIIEIPPYLSGTARGNSPCTLSRLNDNKEWFVTTPVVALLKNSLVRYVWEEKTPDLQTILEGIADLDGQRLVSVNTIGL